MKICMIRSSRCFYKIFLAVKMATQVLADYLKSVFKHKDFKSKLQREAIECLHEGKLK